MSVGEFSPECEGCMKTGEAAYYCLSIGKVPEKYILSLQCSKDYYKRKERGDDPKSGGRCVSKKLIASKPGPPRASIPNSSNGGR